MSTDQQSWVVSVAAHSPGPFESASIRNILEQSDLGGDIQSFCGGTMSITLTLAVTAPAEHKAYQRVLARVKDALGSRWEVQADPGVAAMGQPT
ncbi:MAG TPA: hypothetical protein VLD86_09540 [Ilumatobacteraceae bacterium]|nr:hypothetical protein [Ilumatobacteraceae bacterium]